MPGGGDRGAGRLDHMIQDPLAPPPKGRYGSPLSLCGLVGSPPPCGVVWWMEGRHLNYGKGLSMVNLLQGSLDIAIMVA